jgi:methionine-rich copper-binding protein CopC
MQRVIIFFFLMTLSSPGAANALNLFYVNNNPTPANQTEQFVSSTPRANQTLSTAPEAVIITFSNPVNPDKSSIKVYDSYGTQLGDGKVTVSGTAMTTSLPPLDSGRYAVKWRTRCMCADDSELSDEFHFTVQ